VLSKLHTFAHDHDEQFPTQGAQGIVEEASPMREVPSADAKALKGQIGSTSA